MRSKTDAELVRLALHSQADFRYLIEKYEKPLFRYIRRISNFSVEDAEDILQEVFIKVYRNLNDFDMDLKFSSWIYRITRNQVISEYRKKKARPQTYQSEISEEILEKMRGDFDAEKEIEINLNNDFINKILSQMDLKYREVLILRYFEEMEYREISDVLKKPEGTVGALLNRAKKNFFEQCKKYEQITR